MKERILDLLLQRELDPIPYKALIEVKKVEFRNSSILYASHSLSTS